MSEDEAAAASNSKDDDVLFAGDDSLPEEIRKGIPVFLRKLMAMINNPETDHLIAWSENGETFIVKNATDLAAKVLPKYFKHRNFTSLVRQLNMYDFHKVFSIRGGRGDQVWEFVHPCVQRGEHSKLLLVKRKPEGNSLAKRKEMISKEVSNVMSSMRAMQSQHEAIASKFNEMKRENQALYQEITMLRHSHQVQEEKVGKIMMFLNRMVNGAHVAAVAPPAAKRLALTSENQHLANPLPGISPPIGQPTTTTTVAAAAAAAAAATAAQTAADGAVVAPPTTSAAGGASQNTLVPSMPPLSPWNTGADVHFDVTQSLAKTRENLDAARQQLAAGGVMDEGFVAGLFEQQSRLPSSSQQNQSLGTGTGTGTGTGAPAAAVGKPQAGAKRRRAPGPLVGLDDSGLAGAPAAAAAAAAAANPVLYSPLSHFLAPFDVASTASSNNNNLGTDPLLLLGSNMGVPQSAIEVSETLAAVEKKRARKDNS